mgnify:FL=1
MALAASGSRLQIPDAIYKFCVFMLLMRIGLEGGMEIREAELAEMLLPALLAVENSLPAATQPRSPCSEGKRICHQPPN